MIRMCIVDRIPFPFKHISRKRLPVVVIICWIIGFAIFVDEILDERIWTSCIVWRIRKIDDILIISNRKPSICRT